MGQLIHIAVPGGTAEAWLSRPDDDGGHPGVLLFTDAFGIRPQIQQMADRIAGWGYVVLAPHVFHRFGSVGELAPTSDLRDDDASADYRAQAFARVRRLTADSVEPDLSPYVDELLAVPGVTSPIGVTGYCMGARLALRTSWLRADVVAACGGFHGGRLATDDEDSPHLGLARARAAYVFGHADHDRSMPPEGIDRLERALDEAGLEHVSEVYAGAPHGFTMADTSNYDEDAAERHYQALEDLFSRSLGARSPSR